MDVNPQMHKAVVPEQHNAQVPHLPRLVLTCAFTGRGPKFCTSTALLQGVEKCLGVTPYARVSVHDGSLLQS